MTFVLQFSQNWYILFLAFFSAWLILAAIRRSHRDRREAKEQVCLAAAGSFTLVSMEVFATSMNLWNYVPQNWPIILWPTYFVAILFGYQLLRSIEDLFSQSNPRHNTECPTKSNLPSRLSQQEKQR
jgi:O-antigen/teichoic acid export membrane protein